MPACFQGSTTIETGLSDFHKMSLSAMKVFYKKQMPNILDIAIIKNLIMKFLLTISKSNFLKIMNF